MKELIKIAIAEDHTLFRAALSGLLNDFDEFEVLIQAENGKMLLNQLNEDSGIDLVLVDIEMPEMDGPSTVKELRKRYKNTIKVLALSMHKEYRLVNEMLQSGANGFLSKDSSTEELKTAIYSVMRHDFYLHSEMSAMVFGKHFKTLGFEDSLNDIEEDIVVLVCQQKTNVEIAEALNLSLNTINSYRTRILDKINATNTAGLVIYAIKHGLFKLD